MGPAHVMLPLDAESLALHPRGEWVLDSLWRFLAMERPGRGMQGIHRGMAFGTVGAMHWQCGTPEDRPARLPTVDCSRVQQGTLLADRAWKGTETDSD